MALASEMMDRRTLLAGLASGCVVALAGCQTNPSTGRQQLLLVSEGDLAQLSATTWRQTLEQERRVTDAAVVRRVSGVGQKLADRSGLARMPWEFAVFDSDQINAFVLPGGKVGVYRGILNLFENDDQLATVIGHEIGHVRGRHAAERVSQQIAAQVGLTVAQVALQQNEVRYAREIAGALGAGVTFGVILPFSRTQEYEADRLGVDIMAAGGYDPRQAVAFWDRMTQANAQRRQPLEFMSTHPSDGNRIAALNQYVVQRGYRA